MKSDIVLESTNKGFVSMHFWAIVWVAIFWIFKCWCEGYVASIGMYDLPWPVLGIYVSYGVMGLILIINAYMVIYAAREVNIFRHGENGFLEKIICCSYGFPFSKNTNEVIFNRVIEIEVVQGSLDRLLDTGNLNLKLTIFTNADSEETNWIVSAIKHPYIRKEEIERSLAKHEGLLIKK
ncbi:PH domain-containing protein [Candidatus Roizmanbacteria bacterium]|nr:PH domain-containing protein [Candidatus Roizmanbacteria bacterium]